MSRPKLCEECHAEGVTHRCEKGMYLGTNCVSYHVGVLFHEVKELDAD